MATRKRAKVRATTPKGQTKEFTWAEREGPNDVMIRYTSEASPSGTTKAKWLAQGGKKSRGKGLDADEQSAGLEVEQIISADAASIVVARKC